MASLTPTAYYARLTIKYGGIALVALMVGRFTWGRFAAWWEATHPPPPPAPDVAFGVLPNIRFPKKPLPELVYSLDMPTGQLPNLGDRSLVYLMPAKKSPLSALDEAKAVAKGFGYETEPEMKTEEFYQFKQEEPLPAVMNSFIYWGVFTHTVNWSVDQDFLKVKKLPREEQAIDEVKSLLKKAGVLAQDLNKGEAKITYLKAYNQAYQETVSLSEADFIQVDLFRRPVEEDKPGYAPDPRHGQVRAIVSGNNKARVVFVEYYYYPVDVNTAGVYPLKTANQALAELQMGQGFLAQVDINNKNVVIRRVSLGFYESTQPQYYYQPIYVFSGDNDFTAYVEAVAPPTAVPTLTPEPMN